jgi:nitroimidazol reductase NimA-like FMN-containing flavoprotein (pyridoxamine 5'-phosphate oxidase superfamily)
MPERARTDRGELDALLDSQLVAHVAFADPSGGGPRVLPIAYARDGDRMLVHGSTGSPWLRALSAGVPAAVAVTELSALVVARSAFESGMHYRSAVLYGSFVVVPDEAKAAALDALVDAIVPGRTGEVRPSSRKELAATLVLALPIERWSLKAAGDDPDDTPDDVAGPAWAGLVPLRTLWGDPVPAADLRAGIDVPASVRALGGPAPLG